MSINITTQQKNETLNRDELVVAVSVEGATPSRKDLQVKIAAKANAKPELVVIDHIKTGFGNAGVEVTAYVYKSEKISGPNLPG